MSNGRLFMPANSLTESETSVSGIGGTTKMRITAVALGLLLSSPALAADVTGVPCIVDGDTIAIGETKIRLEGIDAPETDQLGMPSAGAGRVELQHATSLRNAGGKPWTCHGHGQDRYGRSLATCEVSGEDIDRWMVREGWALSFVRYSHAYDADEKAAAQPPTRVFSLRAAPSGPLPTSLIWQPEASLPLLHPIPHSSPTPKNHPINPPKLRET